MCLFYHKLTHVQSSLQFSTAKFVIQHLSWNNAVISTGIQKKLCLAIIAALTKHRSQSWNGYLSMSSYMRSTSSGDISSFDKWAWRVVTRAHLSDDNGYVIYTQN
jgi:hypothetical protein